MVNVDRRLCEHFSDSPLVLTWTDSEGAARTCKPCPQFRGAFLVLQLHDELLYEVTVADLEEVAGVVRWEIEHALPLSVPFQVKLKVGPSWGRLQSHRPSQ